MELKARAVVGFGIDVVDVSEFSLLLEGLGAEHVSRYFTVLELADVEGSANRLERLAGRFAAKEAVMKSLAIGFGNGVSFTDVEIVSEGVGSPTVRVYRRLAEHQSILGIDSWTVSISHSAGVAVAGALALSSLLVR